LYRVHREDPDEIDSAFVGRRPVKTGLSAHAKSL
jgi:hypothetical protein